MATAAPTAQAPPATSNPGNSSRGGGRGGSRGNRQNPGPPGRGNRRGRGGQGGQRGRGDIISTATAGPSNQPDPLKPPLPDSGGGGTSGDRSTEDARMEQSEEVEAEVCFICASPVVHQAVAPCNHRTCHICALRLRALYKTRACAHCRTEAKFVIFTDDAVKRFEDFAETDFQKADEVLGIKYERQEIFDDTILLLRYNCPDESCDIACLGWPDLHRHVKTQHGKFMCDLCTRNKKVFTHEHELFTHTDLKKHEKFGDDNPGAIDQSGFKGHPECGFCRKRFYGDDELFTHCRDRHEKCHICDRRNAGRRTQQYYVDYNALEVHFRKDHFLCPDTECLEKKFVVFESEMDMKAHQLENHPNGLTKDGRRDARRVDISTFDYRTPHQQEPRGGRQGRGREGRGRGRDPNAEPIPPSSAQPLRRDELAYQRQMAMVQSAQQSTTRAFGGQLTAPSRPETPRTNPMNPQPPSMATLNINPPPPPSTQALTPHDQARQIHHAAVQSRASTLLAHSPTKTASFRTQVSLYRTGSITAPALIDSLTTLFDVPPAALGKLVKELADIYEDPTKRTSLLHAWNDWRAINEDYPELPGPGPSGVSDGANTGAGGRRVLRLKSATQASSRSAVGEQASWGGAGSANSPFPALPAVSANRAGPAKNGPVPWTGASGPSGASGASGSGASEYGSGPVGPRAETRTRAPKESVGMAGRQGQGRGMGMGPGTDAFPALPAAQKPNTLMFGIHSGTVRWRDPRAVAPVNPWGGPGQSGQSSGNSRDASTSAGASEVEGEEGPGGAGGKRKGKKKQTLYRFG